VETAAAVAGWDDALATLEFFHAGDHFELEGTTVVFFLVGCFWWGEEGGGRAWDGDWDCGGGGVGAEVC
jgi:hypothetical protein